MRCSLPFLNTRPWRAGLEALLVGTILWSGLLIFQNQLAVSILERRIDFIVGPVCMLFYVLRLRLPTDFLRRQSIFDATTGVMLSLVLSGVELAFALFHGAVPYHFWKGSTGPFQFILLALILNCTVMVIFRIGIRLLVYWDWLRRRQLRWALTHAHVLVVALGAGLLIVTVEALFLISSRNFSLFVPTLLGLVFLSGIALVAVVPPSALFSYLVIRRTTRRLEALAAATNALRNGNYTVRVPIIGEDEVAQLQSNFNAMAADLERAMHETVGGLLHARRELIANVSHELRTPMATLLSYLETTLMHWEENSQPTLQHDLQVMENEVIRLQGLVEDLFMLSRAEVGKLTLRCEPTDVGKLVQRVVETGAPLAWRTSKIEMVADVLSVLPCALVDGSRLEQVLWNLLHNAVRHTSPGGIVAVVVTAEAEAVVINVKDTGEGIAPGDLPHIWERFYQTESSRARMGSGTGLGLALVKELIEAMGGTVAVESVPGEGSCFSLRLPIARTAHCLHP
jgi:signal transduction histidine kinase